LRSYKMLFIFSSLLLFSDANAIEISFSAEDAGESVSIFDDYDAGNGIAISEDAKAKFGCLEMIDNRIVEGTGDVNMIQNMAGSGGHTGQSIVGALASSGRVENHAYLYPSDLFVYQKAALQGSMINVELNLQNTESFAYTYSGATDGLIDANQFIKTGSVHAFQDTHISAASGKAESFAENLKENQIQNNAAITEIWLNNGELFAVQNADALSRRSWVSQDATLQASLGASDTRCWNNENGNWAGAANKGEFGIKLQMNQLADADGFNSNALQQFTAETSSAQNSYAWGVSEARWAIDPDQSLFEGAWITSGIYTANSILRFEGNSHSDDWITTAAFSSEQTGSGVASGVAGYYRGLPSGDPHFLGITPVLLFSNSLSKPTVPPNQAQGNSQENSEETVRVVEILV